MPASGPTGSPASSPGWRTATPVPTGASASRRRRSCCRPRHGSITGGGRPVPWPSSSHASCTRCASAVEAIGAAVDAHRNGVPWHLAASTSYGNGALSRAAAVGAVHAGRPAAVSLAASLDTVVTHADRRAVAASATLATVIAALIRRDPSTSPADIVGTVGPATGGVLAPQTLALALRCALDDDDPSAAVAAAVAMEGLAAGAITGALVGAIHGAAALPPAWRNVEGAAAYPVLARRIAASTDRARFGHLVPHRPLRLDGVDRPRRCGRVRPVLRQPAVDRRRRHRHRRAVRRPRSPRRARRCRPARTRPLDRRALRATRARHRSTTRSACCSIAPSAGAATTPTSSSSSSPTAARTPAGTGPKRSCSPASATSATAAGRSCSSAPTRTATPRVAVSASRPATSATTTPARWACKPPTAASTAPCRRVARQGPRRSSAGQGRLLGRPQGGRGSVARRRPRRRGR